MAVVQDLDQTFVDTQLACPPGKPRAEIVDPHRTGLYIEVRASSPGEGTYYVRYKSAGKTCHTKIGRTREMSLEEARVRAVQIKALALGQQPKASEVPQSRHSAPMPPVPARPSEADGSMILDAFMTAHYFPHAKAHKRSHGRDEQLYRLRIKPRFGHLSLSGVTRRAVQSFHNELAAEGLSKASANQHVQLLRRVCNLAVSWEMLDRNVLKGIPLFTLDNQVENYLDDEQVERLVEVLKTDKNRMVCMILMFLLSTGARLNEALCAEWKQVDAEKGIWRIPATNSKSKRMKSLPLNSSALWVIGQLDTQGTSKYLFPSPATGRPFTTITRVWWRIKKEARLPDNVRIHDLRHTFASRLVSRGRSLYEVQMLLGHADTRTSQRYSHLSMTRALEASNVAAFAVA